MCVATTVYDGDLPAGLVAQLCGSSIVAVDTETSGLDWRVDRLQLCQVFSPSTGPLLIRSAPSRPENLARLLEDEGVVKVFHHAPFDLRFLESAWGVRVSNIACTKSASKILRPELVPAEHGLIRLLATELGVTISKGAVRTSDWGSSNLSHEQVAYASADVSHLIDLLASLVDKVRKLDLLQTYELVCKYIPLDAHFEVAGIPNPLTY